MAITLSHPTNKITGSIHLTASKSMSNRALMIRALCKENFEIKNLATAKDTVTLNHLLADAHGAYDVGHAGTVMRFMTAFLALQDGEHIISGSERMHQRPIKILVEALRELGVQIHYLKKEGYPPLQIQGGSIKGGVIELDGSISSQYISALLLIAPVLKNGLTIQFKGEVISKPYIDMTVQMMQYFGVEVSWNANTMVVKEGAYQPKELVVEADWSSASYWYGMVALAEEAEMELFGLNENSLQGDAVVKDIYKNLGVQTYFMENGIRIKKNPATSTQHSTLNVDFLTCPDIAQTVAVTCAALNVKAKFTGLKTLRIKETDRIFALQKELSKLGFDVEEVKDDLIINPSSSCHPEFNRRIDKRNKIASHSFARTSIDTYDDHRMAMAFAPLAFKAPITIHDEAVVVKSYPEFWGDLEKVGFKIN